MKNLFFTFFVVCCFSISPVFSQTCSSLNIGIGVSNSRPCINSSTSFWRTGDWQLQNNVKWFVDGAQVGSGSNLNYTFTNSGSHIIKISGTTSDNTCTKETDLTVIVAPIVGPITGPTKVMPNTNQVYSVPNMGTGTYNWWYTTDAQITSGQNTSSATYHFGNSISDNFTVNIGYTSANGCYTQSSLAVGKGLSCVDSIVKALITRNQVQLKATNNPTGNCITTTADKINQTAVFFYPSQVSLSRPSVSTDIATLIVEGTSFKDTVTYKANPVGSSFLTFDNSKRGKTILDTIKVKSFGFRISVGSTSQNVVAVVQIGVIQPLTWNVVQNGAVAIGTCKKDSISLDFTQDETIDAQAGAKLTLQLDPKVDYLGFDSTYFKYLNRNGQTINYSLRKNLKAGFHIGLKYFISGNCAAFGTKGNVPAVDLVTINYTTNSPNTKTATINYNIGVPVLSPNISGMPSTILTSARARVNLIVPITNADFNGYLKLKYKQNPGLLKFLKDSTIMLRGGTIINQSEFTINYFSDTTVIITLPQTAITKGQNITISLLLEALPCVSGTQNPLNPLLKIEYGCNANKICGNDGTQSISANIIKDLPTVSYIKDVMPGYKQLSCQQIKHTRKWEHVFLNNGNIPVLGARFFFLQSPGHFTVVPKNGFGVFIAKKGKARQAAGKMFQQATPTSTRPGGFPCMQDVPEALYNPYPNPTKYNFNDIVNYVQLDRWEVGDTVIFWREVYDCCPDKFSQYSPYSNSLYMENTEAWCAYPKDNCDTIRTSINHYWNNFLYTNIKHDLQMNTVAAYDTLGFDVKILNVSNNIMEFNPRKRSRLLVKLRFSKDLSYFAKNQPSIFPANNNFSAWKPNRVISNYRNQEVVIRGTSPNPIYQVQDSVTLIYDLSKILTGNTDNENNVIWDQYFKNSRFHFDFFTYCPFGGTDGKAKFDYEFLFQPDTSCTTCLIPLNAASPYNVIVNCPGCLIPGTIMNAFSLDRTTLGYIDTDNNGYPDQQIPVRLSPNSYHVKNTAITGDTLSHSGRIGMNRDSITYTKVPFKLNLYMLEEFPGGSVLKRISQKITALKGTEKYVLDVPFQDLKDTTVGGTKIFFYDFSLSTLRRYGLPLSFGDSTTDQMHFEWQAGLIVAGNSVPAVKDGLVNAHPVYTGATLTMKQAYDGWFKTTKNNLLDAGVHSVSITDKNKFMLCETKDSYYNLLSFGKSINFQSSLIDKCEIGYLFRHAINYVDPNASGDPFPYEFRPLHMPDSIIIGYPKGYYPTRVRLRNEYAYQFKTNEIESTKFKKLTDTTSVIYPLKDFFTYINQPSPTNNYTNKLPIWENWSDQYWNIFLSKNDCIAPFPNVTFGAAATVYNQPSPSLNLSAAVSNKKLPLQTLKANLKADIQYLVRDVSDTIVTVPENLLRILNDSGYVFSQNGNADSVKYFTAPYAFVAIMDKQGKQYLKSATIAGRTMEMYRNSGLATLLSTDLAAGDRQNGPSKSNLGFTFRYKDCPAYDPNRKDTLRLVYGWACDTVKSLTPGMSCIRQMKEIPIIVQVKYPLLTTGFTKTDSNLASCTYKPQTFTIKKISGGRILELNPLVSFEKSSDVQLDSNNCSMTYWFTKNNQSITKTLTQRPLWINGNYQFGTRKISDTDLQNVGPDSVRITMPLRASCKATSSGKVTMTVTAYNTPFCGSIAAPGLVKNLYLPTFNQDSLTVTISKDTIKNCSSAPKTIIVTVKNTSKKATARINILQFDAVTDLTLVGKDTANIPLLAANGVYTASFVVQLTQGYPIKGSVFNISSNLISTLQNTCNGTICKKVDTLKYNGSLVALMCDSTLPECVAIQGIGFNSKTIMPAIIGQPDSITNYYGGGDFSGTYLLKGNIKLWNGTYNIRPGTKFYVYGNYLPNYKGTDFVSGSSERISPYIILGNSILNVDSSTFEPICLKMWGGIVANNNSEIVLKKSNISGSYLATSSYYTSSNVNDPKDIQITATNNTFNNNNLSILANSAPVISSPKKRGPNAFIKLEGNNFLYDDNARFLQPVFSPFRANTHMYISGLNLYSVSITGNTIKNAEVGIRLLNQFNIPSVISGNQIDDMNFNGILLDGSNRNILVENNSIKMSLSGGKENYGITSVASGSEVKLRNNNITGDKQNTIGIAWGIGTQPSGLIAGSTGSSIEGNKVTDAKLGLFQNGSYPLNSGKLKVAGNNLVNTSTGIFRGPDLQLSNSEIEMSCNTFDNANNSDVVRGIVLQDGANVGQLGTVDQPSGNKFLNFSAGDRAALENKQSDPITYYRHSSEPAVTFKGAVLVSPSNNAPSCSLLGYNQGNFRIASLLEEDIAWMQDSLRQQNGTSQELRQYETYIAKYYQENNDMTGLETYTSSIINCNRKTYYNYYQYLMYQHYAIGNMQKAESCKQALLLPDPNNAYAKSQAIWFDYLHRSETTPVLLNEKASLQDSLDLVYIALSGTPLAASACMQLQLHFLGYPCSLLHNSTSYQNTLANCQNPTNYRKDGDEGPVANKFKGEAWLGDASPNPAKGEAVVSYYIPANGEGSYIKLIDLSNGRQINTSILIQGEGYIKLNTMELISGVYSYTLMMNELPIITKKLVVLK